MGNSDEEKNFVQKNAGIIHPMNHRCLDGTRKEEELKSWVYRRIKKEVGPSGNRKGRVRKKGLQGRLVEVSYRQPQLNLKGKEINPLTNAFVFLNGKGLGQKRSEG